MCKLYLFCYTRAICTSYCFLLALFSSRASQTGPSTPFVATERFSGGHEQRPSLGSFPAIFHNPSVAIY